MNPRVRIDASTRVLLEPIPPTPPPVPVSQATPEYIELDLRSNYSFLQGASSPEWLVQHAAQLGFNTIALTDRDGLYGSVRALEESERTGVRVIVGCEVTVGEHAPYGTVVLHVENHAGYVNLCKLLTLGHARRKKGKPRLPSEGLPKNCFSEIPLEALCAHTDGLWALVDPRCARALGGEPVWEALIRAFGHRLSVRIVRHLDGEDAALERDVLQVVQTFGVPVCATQGVRYATRSEKPIFDVLHCIREGCMLEEAGRALAINDEAHLKSAEQMLQLFSDHPEWLARSVEIGTACRFSLKELKYQFPHELDAPAHPDETPDEALRRLTEEGMTIRYPSGTPPSVRAQVEKELALVKRRQVAPFFLSVKTVVEMARARDILCQGRGSAANSAVCYCLGITAVDPARSNLLFERFLSDNRKEPPDIDVDFEHERREEVIQDIYRRYGRERAAMVSEVICYRGRSALREVGKVFGLSLEQVDRLSQLLHWWDEVKGIDPERLHAIGFDGTDPRFAQVIDYAQRIQGFPRHLSIHVGGFVLSAAPLSQVAPVEPATMPDRTIVPWDKDDLDTLGFFKLDVLGLGMLSALKRALAFAQDTDGADAISAPSAIERLARIPPEDPRVYQAMCEADTVGVFQIESRAQMSMLPRLKPRQFYDLVVEVAIVRPGPIQGGMVHPYLRRRNGEEKPEAPHPILEPILNRTLGVPIFQEQVMQIAIEGAGYSGGEADQLRRDMAAWRKTGNLERHRARLTTAFLSRGISQEFADRLYDQMKGFADYGFPESHAASFALLVYASAWLKVHHPAAFAAALINSQPMGFYSPSVILNDAKRHGVEVRPIDILRSDWDCTLEPSERDHPAIRVGLRQVKGLGEDAGRRVERARAAMPFHSIDDLASRAQLSAREQTVLAESGAFEPLLPGRRQAMWHVRAPAAPGMWAQASIPEAQPMLPQLGERDTLMLDYARTGFSVADHPMRWVRPKLGRKVLSARDFLTRRNREPAQTAGLVICRQRPQTASGVVFLTLEDETGFLNWVLYAKVFERLRLEATTSNLLLGSGLVERSGDVVYLVVHSLTPLTLDGNAMDNVSRDFH